MIKHIVSWKIKNFAEGSTKAENIAKMREQLLLLKEKIKEISSLEVGINSKKASKQNFDIVLISTHNSWADLEAYQKHPEHIKVAGFVMRVHESRACVDFEY